MPRRYLALCGAVFLAALFALWRFGYHGVDPRLIVWPPPDDAPPLEALEETAELDVANMPLDEVLKLLAEKHHVEIELDGFADGRCSPADRSDSGRRAPRLTPRGAGLARPGAR